MYETAAGRMTTTRFTESVELQKWRLTLPARSTVAFVPTMGALHAGHEQLLGTARSMADIVIASIFVNPLQFDDESDLETYPRTLGADIEVCRRSNTDAIFIPTVNEMYGSHNFPIISSGIIGAMYEGEHRPGHFDGVLTVVDRLFTLVSPDMAIFGVKDFQQLFLVRQMTTVRHPHISIISVPTVREPDGLALSSRNSRLHPAARLVAPKLYECLRHIEMQYRSGIIKTRELERHGRDFLGRFEEISIDYLVCVDARELTSIEFVGNSAVMLIAATIANVRLIDNILLN